MVNGVKPHLLTTELKKHDIGQLAWPETPGNGEMKAPADAALFPLLLPFLLIRLPSLLSFLSCKVQSYNKLLNPLPQSPKK